MNQRVSRTVAFVDLDHALLRSSPGPALTKALGDAGVKRRELFGVADLAHRLLDLLGGPFANDLLVRAAIRLFAGTDAQDLHAAGKHAAPAIEDLVAPHARPILREHRDARQRLVLTTVLPVELAEPIADQLGFDGVVATRVGIRDGRLDGRVTGTVVWSRGKLQAAREWASANGASLRRSFAYAGSVHDAPFLAAVGKPVVVDPDPRMALLAWLTGWPTRSFRAPAGVLTIGGFEVQDLLRPFARPELFPFANIRIDGLANIPSSGPAIVVANHRSYFDALAVSFVLQRSGRNSRFLGKKEVFDAPVVGQAARWIGGIRVERGTGSDEPLKAAAAALDAGDVIGIMPEGTIPRGPAFFEPELKGRWGAARLAAMTGAPVIPIGLWGTEKVWPRNSRLPNLNPLRRPVVTAQVGAEVTIGRKSVKADTAAIMTAIVDLLPEEARVRREPTPEELARTYPAGYKGDPSRETTRRPGSDS